MTLTLDASKIDRSLPTRGAWIEMTRQRRLFPAHQSLPTRGAWIEMKSGSKRKRKRKRRSPHGERGLKFRTVPAGCRRHSRSPHGERGLKYGEKKAGTSRENPFLKQVYVLLGGYAEENYVVPVQLEVKEMEDQSENRLYLSVVLTKIAPEVLEKALSGKPGSIPRLFSDAKISIADIFRNVNRSPPTRGAWIEIEVESREPAAEVSSAVRRTQDSDGNEKAARRGGTRASIDRYSYQGKSMTENSEIYSYDFLTHQPDMKVVELPALSEVKSDNKIDR